MTEDEQIWRTYAMAAALLSGNIRDGIVDELCRVNQYSQEDTQAIKRHMQGMIDFHHSMMNHYLKRSVERI